MTRLAAIDHVKVIRVHTRVPVVAPERVTPALVRALRTGKATFMVLHANHPRELDRRSARRLRARDRRRHSDAVAVGAAARRQRRRGNARRLDARVGRMPDQALLPAPCRSRARHGAFAHDNRGRPGFDARAARPLFRPMPAALCARHSRRPRQIADRAQLSERRSEVRSPISKARGTFIRRALRD